MEMKKVTEAILVGGVLAVSMMNANAAVVAIASAATAQAAVPVATSAAGGYVVSAFNLTLSAHTSLAYDGDPTAVGVHSANAKGMHTFGGSTAGGAVRACQTTSVSVPTATTVSSISAGC